MIRRTIGLLILLTLGACAAGSPTAIETAALDGSAWVLAALPGQAPAAGATPTLEFAEGEVRGTDGCNRYFAAYTQTGAELRVSDRGGMSMMACEPAVMERAEAFMTALNAAERVRVSAGELELLGADGAVLATFAEQPRTLAGSAWQVTGFNNGRQAVVSPLPGTDLSITFTADGRVSGSAGCNRFSGTFDLAGERLTIGPVAATRRSCEAPPGVMDQEQQFLKALATVAGVSFEGDRLDLRSAADALAVVLVRDS